MVLKTSRVNGKENQHKMTHAETSRFHVLVTGPQLAEEALALLSKTCRVSFTKPYIPSDELVEKLGRGPADAILVRMGQITQEVIEASPRLKVISKHGIGVDNIDIAAATRRNIPVTIACRANFESVAEHVLGLMFSLARNIPWLDTRFRQGRWEKPNYQGFELYAKTLGLVGFGRIGRRVRELVAPLKMTILVYDPLIRPETLPPDATRVHELETLLDRADIVSLHCPLTEKTRHLIGKNEFKRMKKTAWLINTARGAIVDQTALIEALEAGEIAAAGLDTFEEEPPAAITRLAGAGKTVLTPHIAGLTEASFRRMGLEAAGNILTVLEGKKPDLECVVNAEVIK